MSSKTFSPLIIFLLLALSIIYGYQIRSGSGNFLYTDFGKFYQTTRFFLTGKNIYTKIYVKKVVSPTSNQTKSYIKQTSSDLNPPFFTLALTPLGLLNYNNAYLTWCVLSLLCGIISTFLLQRAMDLKSDLNVLLGLNLVLFVYFPTFANIQFGQVSLILLPVLAGAWLAAKKEYLSIAGILLGLATGLKIIFGLFLFYFILRREWRGLFWFLATSALCALLGLLVFGVQTYIDYYKLVHHVFWYASTWNASLLGFFLRLFGGSEKNAALFSLPWLSHKFYLACSGLILLGLFKFLSPNKNISSLTKTDFDFSIVIVSILLISPLGWLYYFSWLIIPFLVCWKYLEQHPHADALRILTAIAIAFSGIYHDLQSSAKITQDNVLNLFIFSCFYTLALLILLLVLYILRFSNLSTLKNPMILVDKRILPYAVALLISLFSIINFVNQGALYGRHIVLTYTSPFFGT